MQNPIFPRFPAFYFTEVAVIGFTAVLEVTATENYTVTSLLSYDDVNVLTKLRL